MADGLFFANPCFVQYIDLLRQVHGLIQAGTDESPEGDAIRDQMDMPGEALSSAEVIAIKGIAADFYSLGEPLTLAESSETQESISRRHAATEACDAGRYHEALDLLRGCAANLAPAKLAYLRGSVWRAAGHEKVAALFFHRSSEIGSRSERFLDLGLEGSTPQHEEPIT
ncbi:MAG: hypothetical protein ACREJM_04545 [Candidatus Saccharimonadales bacterium]